MRLNIKKVLMAAVLSCAAVSPVFAQNDGTVSGAASQQSQVNFIRYYEQLLSNMNAQLKQLQDQNAVLESKIAQLERGLEAANQENAALKKEVENLRKALAQESSTRDDQMKKVIQNIDKLAQNTGSSFVSTGGNKLEPLEYEEYVVQQGATLSAISKAYNVTVQDIKTANGLKSDQIRVGQVLLIPIK